MSSVKSLYKGNPGYFLLLFIGRVSYFLSFRRIKIVGKENLPKDAKVIFGANHCAAVMDALALHMLNREKKVFVARADIFKKPLFQKLLTFLKLMPINRVRDGFYSVLQVEDTIRDSLEVLNNRTSFCIFPEGTHRPMHSLLPFGKGLSRIAYQTAKGSEDEKHVVIVPVGLEYGDYFRMRSTLLIHVAEPFDVTEFLAEKGEMEEQRAYNAIKDEMRERLKQEIVYLPDDDTYASSWEIACISSGDIPERNLVGRFEANRRIAEKLQELKEKDEGKAKKLFEKAEAYAKARKDAGVSRHTAALKHPLASTIFLSLLTLVGMPFALAFFLASLPVFITNALLTSRAEDKAFLNTLRYATSALLWTLLLIVWAVVLFCNFKWYIAAAALIVLFPAPYLVYDYKETVRRTVSGWKFLFNGKLRRQRAALYDEIIKI